MGVGAVGGEPVPYGGVGLLLGRCLLGDQQPLGQLLGLLGGPLQGLLGAGGGGGHALGLARRVFEPSREPPELLGEAGIFPLGRPAALPQLLDERGLLRAPLPRPALGLGQLLAPYGQLGQLGGGLVDGGLHLQQAGRPGRPAVREVGGEHVPLPGHRGQPGVRGDQLLGVLQCRDDHRVRDEAADGPDQRGGPAHEVGDGGRGGGERDALGTAMATGPGLRTARAHRSARGSWAAGHSSPGLCSPPCPGTGTGSPPSSIDARPASRPRSSRIASAAVAGSVTGHRVRRRAEGGRDRDLEPGLDGQHLGGGPEEPGQPVPGAEQRTRAVLAAEPEGQCLVPGRYRRPPALGGRGLVAGRAVGGLGLGQGPLGLLVAGGQFLVDAVQSFDLGLELLVLLLGGDRALLGLVTGGRQPVDLGLGRTGPAAGRVDLAVQPGEPFAPVGDGAGRVLQPALLGGQLAFQVGAVGDGVLQRVFGRLQGRRQLRLLFAVRAASRSRSSGSRPRRSSAGAWEALRTRASASETVPRTRSASWESSYQVCWARWSRGAKQAHLALQFGLAEEGRLQLGLGRVLALLQLGLVGDLVAQPVPQGHQVVGEEPEPGIAQIGLDDGGPAGDGSLPAERFELAAQFVGEVLDTGEVGAHRVQLPQRLLLPLAVLEDARGFLDEGPAAHRVGVQHGVQLALPDDDVHLTPDTGVGEEFLDVEQPAGVAVDLVFAAAIAEHDPSDRHFGVLDGQCAVGIVDRQRDFRAAERRSPGRPGEDHVFHLAAAQELRLCSPMTQESASTTFDFRIPFGSDDAGDPRFEPQGGGGRERF
ncbi:hypothetical protein SBADM41S_07365 [Streptomyces badius]